MPTHTSFALDHAAGAKPVARISPTSRAFVLTTTIVTLLAFASAFTISGFSQVWAGGELGLPVWARFAVPLAVDMPLIAFALSSIARRAQGEPVWPSAAWLGLFSASSIAINVWHGISEAGAHGIALAGLVGLSALVPLAVIATSGEVLSILTAPPRGSAEQRRSIARVADRGLLAERSALATGRLVKLPKRGTPEREDLAAVVRDHVKAFPAASVAERARSTGCPKSSCSKSPRRSKTLGRRHSTAPPCKRLVPATNAVSTVQGGVSLIGWLLCGGCSPCVERRPNALETRGAVTAV